MIRKIGIFLLYIATVILYFIPVWFIIFAAFIWFIFSGNDLMATKFVVWFTKPLVKLEDELKINQ